LPADRSLPETSRRRKTADETFSLGQFTFDCRNLTLLHPQGPKVLTQKEADVLRLLCRNKDRVLKREEILKTVWGDDDYFLGRSLDVFISKLRKYMKEGPFRRNCKLSRVGSG